MPLVIWLARPAPAPFGRSRPTSTGPRYGSRYASAIRADGGRLEVPRVNVSAVSPRVLPERLRRYARETGVSRAAKGVARRLGVDVIRRHYYSPIPDVPRLPHEVWTRESELRGVKLDLEAGLEFVQRRLACALAEYTPPEQPTSNPRDFYLDNGFYGAVDAELLFAMVRHIQPRRVIELGAGASTLDHCGRPRCETALRSSDHRVFDPFPRPGLTDVLAQVAELRRASATEIPLQEFLLLEAGDLLFVDTTHTVKIGSDVNRIILDVLPGACARRLCPLPRHLPAVGLSAPAA